LYSQLTGPLFYVLPQNNYEGVKASQNCLLERFCHFKALWSVEIMICRIYAIADALGCS